MRSKYGYRGLSTYMRCTDFSISSDNSWYSLLGHCLDGWMVVLTYLVVTFVYIAVQDLIIRQGAGVDEQGEAPVVSPC